MEWYSGWYRLTPDKLLFKHFIIIWHLENGFYKLISKNDATRKSHLGRNYLHQMVMSKTKVKCWFLTRKLLFWIVNRGIFRQQLYWSPISTPQSIIDSLIFIFLCIILLQGAELGPLEIQIAEMQQIWLWEQSKLVQLSKEKDKKSMDLICSRNNSPSSLREK